MSTIVPPEFFNTYIERRPIQTNVFLHSTIDSSGETDNIEILRNSSIESRLSKVIRSVSLSWNQPILSQALIESLAILIRNIVNQTIIESFRFSYIDDGENELAITFEAEGFYDCELSIYYDEPNNSVGKAFLMYDTDDKCHIINGTIENVIRNFNEIFTQ